MWVVLVVFGAVVVIGSLAEVNAQSGAYRASTNRGYAALATRVVDASNATGAQLGALMDEAPNLTNDPWPDAGGKTARAEIQQGLDQAVSAADQQASQAAGLVPPDPTGNVSGGITAVMATRASAVAGLRTAIDQLLGMSPLPVAGAPPSPTSTAAVPLQSPEATARAMGAVGRALEGADAAYRVVAATARRQPGPIRLPRSVWVTSPAAEAPLGATRLAAFAPVLAESQALVPFHQLVITAVGLSPPAVASGSPGTIGVGCAKYAQSTAPDSQPSVLPPTATVGVDLTVTNCGTVDESGVPVTETLALADPAGTALPPAGARGASARVEVSVPAGSSVAPSLPPMTVAGGHRYTLTVSLAAPVSQMSNPFGSAGTSQAFLLQITG